MDSIGEILRQARNERGWTLDEVASKTRINRKYLDAIERGDRNSIPGGFFYKSFVRQYASAVSDADSRMAGEIEGMLAAEEPVKVQEPDVQILKAMADRPAQERPGRLRSSSSLTYAVLLIAAVAGSSGLYMWWHQVELHASSPTQAPAQASTPARQPETPAAPEKTPQHAAVQPVASLETPPIAPDEKIVLMVAANEPTWFQVWSDGKSVYSGVLQPGEPKVFAAKEGARMKVGNAGGLEVKFNGRPIGSIGTRGQ